VHLFSPSLHVALLLAHNRIVDRLRTAGVAEADLVDAARVALTWHYQWIVVHDVLPRLVGAELVEQVLAEGGRWCAPEPGHGYIPLEFADAAYRYGHGQIPAGRGRPGGTAVSRPDGLGALRADGRLDFAQVFDLPGRPPAQRAKRLDGRLATSLIGLPEQVSRTCLPQARGTPSPICSPSATTGRNHDREWRDSGGGAPSAPSSSPRRWTVARRSVATCGIRTAT
jgi:hypothetical protein